MLVWSHSNSGYVQAYAACVLQLELSERIGADGVTSKTFHLFQLPWQSAAIQFPQGELSLNSNFSSLQFSLPEALLFQLPSRRRTQKESNL